MTNELIISNTILPKIDANFEELKSSLILELQKYDFVVTHDNVKEAKAKATELNKMYNDLEAKRKAVVKDLSEPIKEFDAKVKEMSALMQDGRTNILDKVAFFDDQTRKLCETLCQEALSEFYAEFGIEKEFQTVSFSDLVIVSNVTEKGNLAKIARDGIKSRVSEASIKQETQKSRIVSLKNRCETAGLKVVFSHDDIKHFVGEPEAEYNKKLDVMINREVERQNKLELTLKAEAEAKLQKEIAKVQEANQQQQPKAEPVPVQAQEVSVPAPAPVLSNRDVIIEVKMQLKISQEEYAKINEASLNHFIAKGFKTYINNTASFRKI